MYITGLPEIDKTIKEIATETIFDINTAKEYYLKTGDKKFCEELSVLRSKGWSWDHINFYADSWVTSKNKKLVDAFKGV